MGMTFEEFKLFYENRGYLPNDVGRRKNTLNEKQIQSRYEKYLKSEQKRLEAQERRASKDEKWEKLKLNLDLRYCSLYERLLVNGMNNTIEQMKINAGVYFQVIDPAHVFGKGAYPHMKYDLDNVVPLNRYSHSMLDQSRDPITGEQLSSEDTKGWWMFIIGSRKYQELLSRSINGRDS